MVEIFGRTPSRSFDMFMEGRWEVNSDGTVARPITQSDAAHRTIHEKHQGKEFRSPVTAMSITWHRERLKLFTYVCLAVQHAHQKGVIHRDLKPSNVLVAHYDTIFDAERGKFVQNFGPRIYGRTRSPTRPTVSCLPFRRSARQVHCAHLASGHETLFSGHEKRVKSVAFSASGEYIASAGQDSFLLITDARTQAVLRKLPVGDKGTAAIAFSPDGNRLATSGEDRIVRIWDTSPWDEIQEFSASPVDFSHCLAFSPDGSLLAYGTPRDDAVVRELATGKEVVLQGHRDAVRSVAFSPDSRFIATGNHSVLGRVARPPTVESSTRMISDILFDLRLVPDARRLVRGDSRLTCRNRWRHGRLRGGRIHCRPGTGLGLWLTAAGKY